MVKSKPNPSPRICVQHNLPSRCCIRPWWWIPFIVVIYLQWKVYQLEVYRFVWFAGPFAYLHQKVYRKISYQLVFIFLPFTYLLRAFVSAQGCISYRRKTCIGKFIFFINLKFNSQNYHTVPNCYENAKYIPWPYS